jgi:hypothetical protein
LNLFDLTLEIFMKVFAKNVFCTSSDLTILQILRTSWSYFALLHQVASSR